MKRENDPGILQAALLGYQQQLDEINAKIAELRRRLGSRGTTTSAGPAPKAPQKKHRISAEGRARIAAAQRRRWAAAKKSAS